MINVSDEFRRLMNERTDFKENAEVTLLDGTVLNFTENEFTLSNNSITDAADANSIPLGVAVCRSIQMELLNEDDHLSECDFFGAKIRLYLTFQLSKTLEKIEYGTFTVISPETYGTTVIITANDDMFKADKEYTTDLTFPTTIKAMLRDCCNTCGIPLSTSDITHGEFIVSSKPTDEYTHRQIIGYIAMIAVGNARINRQGYLEVLSYDFDYTKSHHILTEWGNLKIDTSNISITGIQTTKKVTETVDGKEIEKDVVLLEGSEGYVISVSNPLISGKEQTVLSYISGIFNGIAFRKFEGDHIAYPIAEFMDIVEIADRKGELYKSFITDVNFIFYGFTTLKNSAESGLRNKSKYISDSTETLIKAKELINKEQTEREKAIENLVLRMSESSGMYITTEAQEDGSSIYYMHNKPTLEESDIVWKLTSEAIGISTDGGKTYPYGFMVTGELVTRLLYAEGINADYLNTGAITVKDLNGNIIFSVDMDTGRVIISGDSVMIGGKTVVSVLDEIRKEASSARALQIALTNDYQGIPTDANGDYETINASTQVSVLYGHADVSKDCSYNIAKSEGVAGTWDLSTRTFTLTGLTEDSGWVDITATYLSVFNVTKRFNVSKTRYGLPGDNAKVCNITGGQIMKYVASSEFPEPRTIELMAEYQNTTHGKWQYLDQYDVWVDFVPAETNNQILIAENSIAWRKDTALIRAIDVTQAAMDTITLAKLRDGTDSVTVHVTSVNGFTFKNTGVSTIMTVTVIVGEMIIDTSDKLRDRFGNNAKIIWSYKNVGETKFTQIDRNDPRLSDDGFIFTLSPQDVYNKATLDCGLDY